VVDLPVPIAIQIFLFFSYKTEAVCQWFQGLKAAKDSMDKYVYLRSNPTHEVERMGETTRN
jgi:hypothetical protein